VNFSYAYKVYKVAYDLHLPAVDRSKLISYQHIDELKYVIQLLENRKEFNKARQLSLSCDLDPGLVTVQEVYSCPLFYYTKNMHHFCRIQRYFISVNCTCV